MKLCPTGIPADLPGRPVPMSLNPGGSDQESWGNKIEGDLSKDDLAKSMQHLVSGV